MKLRRHLALGVLALFLLIALALLIFRKTGESDLKKYKAELRAKGEKLTFAELLPPYDGTNDQMPVFIEAAKKLDYPDFNPGTIAWENPDRPGTIQPISVRTNVPMSAYSKGSASINFVSWDSFSAAIRANTHNLNIIRDFLTNPPSRLNAVYDNSFELSKICFVEKRLAAQWLSASVLLHLHSNNTKAAMADLHSMFAVTEMHAIEPTLVNQMVRVAVVRVACPVVRELLAHPISPSEPELKSLQDSIAGIDLLDALEKGMVGERNYSLLTFEFNRQENGNLSKAIAQYTRNQTGSGDASSTVGDDLAGFLWRNTVANNDELFYLQFMQEYVEAIRLLRTEQNSIRTERNLTNYHASLVKVAESWQRLKYPFSSLCIPNFIKATQTCARDETHLRLTVTAIALQRYQLRHGNFPTDLSALVPEFIDKVPTDCMDAKPLKYKLHPDGSFLLYSVGVDGIDDGGDPTPVEVDQHYLWTGRDAVWPGTAITD